jgi:hypothetical protein
VLQQPQEHEAVLVGHLVIIGTQAPVGEQLVAAIDADDDVGIADVDAE